MGSFASIDGRVVPAEEARVSVFDNGFVFGDSVYETLRTYGARPFRLDAHLARLRRSAARLGIEIPLDDRGFAERLDEVLARAANSESYIRMIVTRGVGDISYNFGRVKGPTVVLVAKPFEGFPERHYTEGVAVVISSIRRNHPQALDPAIKSCNLLNNILAVREAQARGAVEAILLNDLGQVAEGASSNVFAVTDGVVTTPPLEAGILPGITREVLLEVGRAKGLEMREDTLRAEDVLRADELFLTSSTREVCPITTVDGQRIGTGRPGPITLRLLSAFREAAPRHAA
jgi:branched-chain amino acid aminotransferase